MQRKRVKSKTDWEWYVGLWLLLSMAALIDGCIKPTPPPVEVVEAKKESEVFAYGDHIMTHSPACECHAPKVKPKESLKRTSKWMYRKKGDENYTVVP